MSNVISLQDARTERSPHWSGYCRCMGCQHEWMGVGPIGTSAELECPECGLPKGVVKHLFGADVGDHVLSCTDCGCDSFAIYKRKKDMMKIVRCISCGLDCTSVFFDG